MQMPFAQHAYFLKKTLLPGLVVGLIVGILGSWHLFGGHLDEPLVTPLVHGAIYLVLFLGYAVYSERSVPHDNLYKNAVYFGLIVGVVSAILKMVALFKVWAVFRLFSEPLITALGTVIAVAIVLLRHKLVQRK